jgi:ubiquinone/menaquinone biosynthesis C-methylase UbiE
MGSKTDVDRFGSWANSYNDSILQRLVFAPMQDFTLHDVMAARPTPAAILDIGCGTGLLLRRASQLFPGAQLTGIDAAEQMVLVAQASVPQGLSLHFARAFAEQLPFPNAAFDLVLTTMSFHHWADQERALHEVCRVLSPGGIFALADALPVGVFHWIFTRNHHGRFNKPEALQAMLLEAGFEVQHFARVPKFSGTVQAVLSRVSALPTG